MVASRADHSNRNGRFERRRAQTDLRCGQGSTGVESPSDLRIAQTGTLRPRYVEPDHQRPST